MTLVLLVGIWILGWLAIDLLEVELTIPEHIGLAWLFGSGLHTLVYFAVNVWLGRVNSNFIALLGELVSLYLLSKKFGKKVQHVQIGHVKGLANKALIGASVLVLGYTLIQSVYWPVYEPDAIHLYDFRAQRLLEGDWHYFLSPNYVNQSQQYPPYTSLMHLFVYQSGGENPKAIYGIGFVAFYLTLFGVVARLSKSSTKGLLVAFATVFSPGVWWNSFLALPSVPFMEYFSLGVIYLMSTDKIQEVIMSSTLFGLAFWVRSEPFWIPVMSLLALIKLLKKEIKSIVISVLIVVGLISVWPHAINYTYTTVTQQLVVETGNMGATWLASVKAAPVVWKQLWGAWGIVLTMFTGVLIVKLVSKEKVTYLDLITMGLVVAFFVGANSFFSRYDNWDELGNSINRMAIILTPLFWTCIFTPAIWDKFIR